MASKNFAVSSSVEVDSFIVNPSSPVDGQSLIYDGTDYSPGDIVPVGTIEMWAGGTTPPHGWLLCNGNSYTWSQYTRLRDVVGIAYGGSNGTSWNLPDMIYGGDEFALPQGLSAGGTRTDSTYEFPASIFSDHSHNHGSAQATSNNSGANTWQHQHNTVSTAAGHNHTLNGANWSHEHNSGEPSGGHSHNYQRGNAAAGNTGNTNHGIHGVSTSNHPHSHTTPAVEFGTHQHVSNAASLDHSHNWNVSGVASTSATSVSHNHTINAQPIYFIIKY